MNLCFQFDYSKSQSLTLLGFFVHTLVILCAGEGKTYHLIAIIFSFFITFVCLVFFFLDLYASQLLSIFFIK